MGPLDIIPIESIDDPRVAFFRELRGNHPRLLQADLILIEGELQIQRLFESGLPIHTLFLETAFYQQFESQIRELALPHITLLSASRAVMAQIIGYRLHRGCMALAQKPPYRELNELCGPAVALDRIVDPENVGSIARNCAAFGVRSILVDDQSADPLLRRAIRVSMGGALFLERAYVPSLAAGARILRDRFQIIGVDNIPNSVALRDAPHLLDRKRSPLLIFGNERQGLSSEIIDASELILSIPMNTSIVSSLNVNAASALCLSWLYEARAEGIDPD